MDNSPLHALFFFSKVSLKLNKYCVQIRNNRKLTLTKRLKTCQVLQRSKEIEDIVKKNIWCIKFSYVILFTMIFIHIECYVSLFEANLFPTHSMILKTKLIKSSVLLRDKWEIKVILIVCCHQFPLVIVWPIQVQVLTLCCEF